MSNDDTRHDLAHTLRNHFFWWPNHASIGSEAHCQCGERPRDWSHWTDHAARMLTSIPGIAVIELPSQGKPTGYSVLIGGEPETVYTRTCAHSGETVIAISGATTIYADEARSLAAALIALAERAEQ